MTEQPYTTADLHTEAARQHAALTKTSFATTVLGQMLDATILSTLVQNGDTGLTWDEALNCGEFDAPRDAIHDLITGAADVSAWAVQLGADGLQPEDHSITIKAAERPLARIHFAFEPGMSDDMRTALVEGISQSLADHL